MAVLVVAEHDNASLNDATLKAVTAAQALTGQNAGGDIDVLVAGENARAAAEAAANIKGVRKVILAEAAPLKRQLAEAMEKTITPLMANYDALVSPATTTGKNFSPRIAAKLDVMHLSDVSAIAEGRFTRPVYAGNALLTVTSGDAKKVLTIRPTAFDAAPAEGGAASVESITPELGDLPAEFVSEERPESERPDLAGAKVVISGGRGLGSGENFRLLEGLADRLGAALGASRAAVDAGFVPNDMQVGQTGKVVAPQLYIAIGISGAIQHLAGMMESGVIVAINKDEEAPIFGVADYGLVGDLFEIIPQLEAALDKA